jgi:hypothetical protein
MQIVDRLIIDAERLADCRDMVETELHDLIERAIRSGYAAEEVLVAVSELAAEELAPALEFPSLH